MATDPPFPLRVCNPAVFPSLFEVERNRFKGVYGVLINEHLEMVGKAFNSTVTIDNLVKRTDDQTSDDDLFNECLNKLQSGDAEIMASGANYPLDIVNVSQEFIILDEKTSFIGAFERPVANKAADFARSVYAFKWSVYLLIMAYLVMFAVFFKFRRLLVVKLFKSRLKLNKLNESRRNRRIKLDLYEKIKKRIKSPCLFDVIRHYIGSNFIEAGSIFSRVLIITIGFFSFTTFACLNSRLNTELVIPPKVNIFESYDQIIKAGAKPIFVKGTTYFNDFKSAQNGSKAKKLWDWAQEEFGSENILLRYDISKLQSYASEIVLGQSVVLIGEILAQNAKMCICDIFDKENYEKVFSVTRSGRQIKDIQIYIRNDQSTTSVIKSMIIGKRLVESKEHFELTRKLFNNIFEKGLVQAVFQVVKNVNIWSRLPGNFLGPSKPEKQESRFICQENNAPVAKTPKINHLRLSNFKFSSLALLTLLFCSVFTLAFEISFSNERK